jgi:hypothetical protein
MRSGFGFIQLEGTSFPLEWAEGDVQRTEVTKGASLEGRNVIPLQAWLCNECGKVELVAEV